MVTLYLGEEAAISFLLMRVEAGLAGPGNIQEKRWGWADSSRSRGRAEPGREEAPSERSRWEPWGLR